MIITKTPFRMSFFGGGTDIKEFYMEHGGSVLSTTFDKYCYVNIRNIPPFFDYKTELLYSETERVNSRNHIKHPLIRETMKYLNVDAVRVAYDADLPARTGLGTSSSFAVGMLNAFYALNYSQVGKRKLADDAIYIERVLCDEAGGIQDQIAAAFGGLNRINMDSSGYHVSPIQIQSERKKILNSNLMLFFTGFSRFSAVIQESNKKNIKDKVSEMLEMKSLVDDAQNILQSECDLSDFGKLLDYTWKLKRGLSSSVSTDCIDLLYQKAIASGAIGGKLLGAGGGGFLLFYVEKDKQVNVRKALGDLLYIPFEFETEGSKIIYLD